MGGLIMSVILNATTSNGLTMTPDNSGTVQFQTAGTNTMYIDGSGNVGIGTSSPAYKLDVNGTVRGRGDVYLGFVSGSQSGVWWSQSNYAVPAFQGLTSAGNVGDIVMQPGGGNLLVGTTTSVGKITQYGGQIVSGRLSNTTNYDASNGSINITSSGDGNPRGVITFGNSSTASQNWHFVSGESGASYSMVWYNGNYGSGTARMQLTTGGALSTTTGTISAISDVNFKENIIDAPNYLSLLNQVKVRKFSYKEENSATQTHIGVIAQELEQILPEMVFDQKDPVKETVHKTVRYTDFVLMLVKSIQELKSTVDAQATEIATLKAKVGA